MSILAIKPILMSLFFSCYTNDTASKDIIIEKTEKFIEYRTNDLLKQSDLGIKYKTTASQWVFISK